MGSLHVYWSAANRVLQLIASTDGSTRIYHRERDDYDLTEITRPSEWPIRSDGGLAGRQPEHW